MCWCPCSEPVFLVFAQFLEFLTCPWYEGDYYGNIPFVGVVVLLIVVIDGGVVAVGWLVIVFKLVVPLVEGPIWELACL